MISSLEEALLLLKKWQQERLAVCAIGSFSGTAFRVTGTIREVDPDGTFLFAGAEKDFLIIRGSECIFGFDTSSLRLPPALAKLLPSADEWDSVLVLGFENGGKLLLFTLE